MVNDDVNNKAINFEIKVAQYSAKAIWRAMKKIIINTNIRIPNSVHVIL